MLLADEFKQLGKNIAAGAGFVSNIILWSEAGYFDGLAETKPLLNMWSLGVEEQFYILWPLLLWLFCRKNFVLLGIITFALAMASFALNLYEVQQDSVSTFYLPQTRFWELLAGGMLAWMMLHKSFSYGAIKTKFGGCHLSIFGVCKKSKAFSVFTNCISIIGVMALCYGFWKINKDTRFPGVWALVPVLGSILIILAGPATWINKYVLSNRVMVWFGLISYPLYLWHWPILTFARILHGEEPSGYIRIVAIFLSIVLAWLTYKLIEQPLRFGGYRGIKVFILIFLMAIVGYIGYNTYIRNGLSFRDKDRQAFVDYFENSIPGWKFSEKMDIFRAYRTDCDFYDLESYRYGRATKIPRQNLDSTCYTRDFHKAHAVFIWGDSHAQQLYYGINKNLPRDWQVLGVTSSGCFPSISGVSDSRVNYCEKSNFMALKYIEESKPDVVVVAQNDMHDVVKSIEIRNKLANLGVSKVIFTGPVPHWNTELPKIIARQLWVFTPERTFVGVNQEFLVANAGLKNDFNANSLIYADVISQFCNESGCLTRIGNDRLKNITTHDYGHLLPVASDYLASNLLVPG